MARCGAIVAGCLAVTVLAAGCSMMRNTPQQDLVWRANAACEAEGRVSNNVVLTRVEPNGRYWVETRNGSNGYAAYVDCMNEKIRAASTSR